MFENSECSNFSEESYSFRDVPLTSGIVEALVQELFSGKVVERHRIAEEVIKEHSARGGRSGSTQSYTARVKLALTNMYNKGLAQNPSRGYWRICVNTSNDNISFKNSLPDKEKLVANSVDGCRAFSDETILQDLGTGSGAVYVYYLPTYKEFAFFRNETVWACKIGRTDRDPAGRIWTQTATALPERPIIALVYRTDFPLEWERILHSVLTLRGLRIQDSPGCEWFVTSPDVVLELLRSIDPATI